LGVKTPGKKLPSRWSFRHRKFQQGQINMKIQATGLSLVALLAATLTTIEPPSGTAFKDPVTMANISKVPGIT
jgi:hypothetical protein